MESSHRIASLHCYPIKSCRGIDLGAAAVERRGFALDRRFMVVDENGKFRTQRMSPQLAWVDVTHVDNRLEISAEGHGACSVDLERAALGQRVTTTVWRHTGASVDQGDEARAFFSDLLGVDSRLVHMADDEIRPINPKNADSEADIVGYADGYPLLVTCTASLRQLEADAGQSVPMDRFRANIIVETDEPWAEDGWRTIVIGDTEFAFTRACGRCVITTTDQRTGEREREPLRTLARTRRTPDGVMFGVYFAPRTVGAQLRPGDLLEVVQRRGA